MALTLADLMYVYFSNATGGGAGTTADVNTELPAASDDADNLVAVAAPQVTGRLFAFDGTNWDRVRIGATAGSILVDSELPAAAAVADNLATPTAPAVAAFPVVYDGSTWDMLRAGTVTGSLKTDEARPSAATISSVGDSASSITVLASNASRKGASFLNLSTAILYLHFGGGTAIAATASSVAIAGSGGYFELPQPCMTNAITGIWASDAAGVVNVTEW